MNSVGRAKPDTDKYEKEVARLKQEMERKEVQYAEGVAKEKSRHTIEEKVGPNIGLLFDCMSLDMIVQLAFIV